MSSEFLLLLSKNIFKNYTNCITLHILYNYILLQRLLSQDGNNIRSKLLQIAVRWSMINRTKKWSQDLRTNPRIYYTRIKIAVWRPQRIRVRRFVLGGCLICKIRLWTADTRASVSPGRIRSIAKAMRIYSARKMHACTNEVIYYVLYTTLNTQLRIYIELFIKQKLNWN